MRFRVVIPRAVQAVADELSPKDQDLLLEKLTVLEKFPRMYQMVERGRFRRHRRLIVGDWGVYYRVVERTVYVRGLWPARLPLKMAARKITSGA